MSNQGEVRVNIFVQFSLKSLKGHFHDWSLATEFRKYNFFLIIIIIIILLTIYQREPERNGFKTL